MKYRRPSNLQEILETHSDFTIAIMSMSALVFFIFLVFSNHFVACTGKDSEKERKVEEEVRAEYKEVKKINPGHLLQKEYEQGKTLDKLGSMIKQNQAGMLFISVSNSWGSICFFCHTRLHLGFSAELRILQVSACNMEPRSGTIITD